MYCVKCGVELADSEKKCPLCGTQVYHPDIVPAEAEGPYPPFQNTAEVLNPRGVLFVLTVLFLIIAAICLLCDWNLSGSRIVWSGYVTGALVLIYVTVVLPYWFRRPSPAVFVPCDFLALGLYLFYINSALGGRWFFTFALPLVAGAAIITTAVAVLSYYIRRGYLFIWSGACILGGVYTVGIEILINITFGVREKLIWSPYPFLALFMIGVMLLVIALVRPLRESLHKKFFL
ncbi:MAG TPA: zinc ribbon domain-containing protein [Clostridiales bacterium]|jgi:hypothetical protein|nr:zinc ribbon domain-containing protein [Clostridiales bacterium]